MTNTSNNPIEEYEKKIKEFKKNGRKPTNNFITMNLQFFGKSPKKSDPMKSLESGNRKTEPQEISIQAFPGGYDEIKNQGREDKSI